jgi:hypothetical protein
VGAVVLEVMVGAVVLEVMVGAVVLEVIVGAVVLEVLNLNIPTLLQSMKIIRLSLRALKGQLKNFLLKLLAQQSTRATKITDMFSLSLGSMIVQTLR